MMSKPLNPGTDADGIPSREAFEWYASGQGNGMALWYRDFKPYFENSSARPNDGVSQEEQQGDKNSLWAYYRELIRMKKMQSAVAEGKYAPISNNNDNVVSFTRVNGEKKVLVMINLSGKEEFTRLSDDVTIRLESMKLIFGSPNSTFGRGARALIMQPYAVQVWTYNL